MKKLEKSVPVIRFKGFSEAWEQRKFIEIINRLSKTSNSSILPKVEYEDIIAEEGRLNKDISNKFDSRKGILFQPKNILYGKLRPYLKNWLYPDFKGVAVGDFWVFEAIEATPRFIYNLIQSDSYQKVANDTAGTKMPRSDWTKVSNSSFFIPKESSEQKRIGTFFKQLDDTIALHQRKLDTLKQMKKGLLQQMFPKSEEDVPKIRFADFDEEWYQRKLGEISDKVIEKNKESTYFETLTNSAEYGIISQREFFNKDISNEKNLNGYYIVRENDFVYNPRISNYAPVGPIKRNKLGRIGIVSPLYYVFRTFDTNQSFLEYYFDGTVWHNFMLLNGDSGARADRFAIKDSVLKEMPIPYSTLYEQEKISFFLDEITIIINLHQNKLKKLSSLKKAYLQNMFI
ncbi:restriction endonuclease subunit S [Listeria monocytogenes]|uniref:Restriction endonuclease subunit S n=1 Tax=Listeria monocytogenes TaxID=1639 RepID=A0A3T1MF84_LISMN|nr:restriction endonuclease subunit S [Listeria monocytogenes]EHC6222341.1 restriction endonuclease subunit S [Listeria monocytogenes serotype 1/2b]AKI45697.1 type I restriction-modification system, S subunit [Listeria monocytogenes]ASD74907.1 type I restriction endonuclease subunit S [Listeria monocytogenes]EAA0085034.1 restriction endonuclease subunit S [Listeria monocytogenes]EAA0194838.1 restriction endonuclease subunit S [Listeria monocytogenes]